MSHFAIRQSATNGLIDGRKLADFLPMESPGAVFDEVKMILHMISPHYHEASVTSSFILAMNLYNGNYPGYRACNTKYHDLRHTTDTFLAMARLIHGAIIQGEALTEHEIQLGLAAALLHDAGYIQKKHDQHGTGAKYTANHVQRSMDFFERYGSEYGLSDDDITSGRSMILCTDLAVEISHIHFPSKQIALLGKMLGTADLLAQMADRIYLEKLLYLYQEFKEAKIGGYKSEIDLLEKTVGFYDFISNRFATALDKVNEFMLYHFLTRWGIMKDLYLEAVENQKNYLKKILRMRGADPRGFLRRSGIVAHIRRKYTQQRFRDIFSINRSVNNRIQPIPQTIS
ncbi:MAG: hypothetical protein JW932_20830 [Deltaproteobacteria bacterium]|nr:hypothetical protein [Deltaproteobacteria bacterium]